MPSCTRCGGMVASAVMLSKSCSCCRLRPHPAAAGSGPGQVLSMCRHRWVVTRYVPCDPGVQATDQLPGVWKAKGSNSAAAEAMVLAVVGRIPQGGTMFVETTIGSGHLAYSCTIHHLQKHHNDVCMDHACPAGPSVSRQPCCASSLPQQGNGPHAPF